MLQINSFNFDTQKNFENKYIPEIPNIYGFKRENDYIEFYSTFVACPCIYYKRCGDLFCFSFDYNDVVKFCNINNIPLNNDGRNLEKTNPLLKVHFKGSVLQTYEYDLDYIEGWKSVKVFKNGDFEVVENDAPIFEYDIKDSKDIIKQWATKYKNAVKNLINREEFLPTLTGGLDTRTFSVFYKNQVEKIPNQTFFVFPVKDDEKKNVEQGAAEVERAQFVASVLGLKNMTHTLGNYYTLSGILNERPGDRLQKTLGRDFVKQYLSHCYLFLGEEKEERYTQWIKPYIDDLILSIHADCFFFRTLFAMIFIPELLDIPIITTSNEWFRKKNRGSFMGECFNSISAAAEIMDSWGEEFCKDLAS